MPIDNRIVAIGLLTARDLERLGTSFTRAYPIDETPCFGELLRAIDEADRAMRLERSDVRDSDRAANESAERDGPGGRPRVHINHGRQRDHALREMGTTESPAGAGSPKR
jgi:hypothetical protein